MARTPKDLAVLCIDVGPPMDVAPPTGDQETALEASLRIAERIVTQKLFAGGRDEMGVVLFGTSGTDNELATTEGGYEYIETGWQMTTPTIELLRYLRQRVKPGNNTADFIDAIVVSMDIIVRATREIAKVGEKKIYLFTNAGSGYSDDGVDQICDGLKKEDIQLIVVGPSLQLDEDNSDGNGGGGGGGARPPSRPSGGSGGGDGGHGGQVFPKVFKTAQQLAGEAMLTRVLREVEGVSFSFSEATQIATFLSKKAKKQTTRFAGCLEIGPQLQIGCKIYTKTMVERPATWKKLSAVSQNSAHPGSMAVRYERSYHLQDEDATEVSQEDTVKGYRYGKSLIPITSEDEDAMKLHADKCLSVLGFTKCENVKPHHFLGTSVQVVAANPNDPTAAVSMSAFIHALYEMGMAVVVRYVFRNNSTPKLCALFPHIKPDYECLYMYQIPFMEDVRQYMFPSLSEGQRNQPTEEQLSAVDDLITSMDLSQAGTDEFGATCEAVRSKKIKNPLIQRCFQCIHHRAINPEDPVPPLSVSIAKLFEPDEQVVSSSETQCKRVKELFTLSKIEKSNAANSNVSDVWKRTADLDLDTEAPSSKRPREEVDVSMAAIAKGEVKQVGTLDPVNDYKMLISSNKEENGFEEASQQLSKVAVQLVKESFGDLLYEKAIGCVKALREEAIKHSKPAIFNDFLCEVKTDLIGTRYSPFWDRIVSKGVSLISSAECAESAVTDEEAQQFLAGQADAELPPPDKPDESDEAEDLLAMMD